MTSRAARILLPVIYLGFISLGLPDGTLGVAWPRMHESLGLPIGIAGTLLLVITLLSAVSGFSSGAISRRFRTGPVVLISCALTGSALLLVAHARDLGWLLLAAIPLGLGAGAVDSGLNGYVARHYSGRHMSWLHACWGIGATCGPLLMTQALTTEHGWRGGYFTLGSIQLGLAAIFLVTLRLWEAVPERPHHQVATATGPAATRAPTTGANSEAGWLSAAIFSLYVAVEMTTGLWASTVLVVSRNVSPEVAGLCTTAYYGSITIGRILTGFVVDHWGNRRTVVLGGLLSFIGVLVFALADSTPVAAAALVLAGLGFAPVYPCLMHEVPRRFAPAAVQTIIGRQSGAGNLGGAFLPAATGWLAQQVSPQAVTWAITIGVALMIAAIRRLDGITPVLAGEPTVALAGPRDESISQPE